MAQIDALAGRQDADEVLLHADHRFGWVADAAEGQRRVATAVLDHHVESARVLPR